MKTKIAFFLAATALWGGCAQQDVNKFKEKAQAEENAKTEAGQDAVNAKAKAMEADLQRRHRFYQSLSGSYAGTFTHSSGMKFTTRLKLIPSLPPYVPTDRIRTLEEISADINNLYFNVQILHWSPGNSASATGCVFQEIRGNLEKGRVEAIRAECPNVYSVRIIDPEKSYQTREELEINSVLLAAKILNNEVNRVTLVKAIMQSSNNSDEYELELAREP